MRIVVIESPYAAPTPEGIQANVDYLRACIRDALQRGEAPFASHALYTQPGVLRDDVPAERELGMRAGFEFHKLADAIVVYQDRGISSGMKGGITRAEKRGQLIEFRNLPSCDVEIFEVTNSEPLYVDDCSVQAEDGWYWREKDPVGPFKTKAEAVANAAARQPKVFTSRTTREPGITTTVMGFEDALGPLGSRHR